MVPLTQLQLQKTKLCNKFKVGGKLRKRETKANNAERDVIRSDGDY